MRVLNFFTTTFSSFREVRTFLLLVALIFSFTNAWSQNGDNWSDILSKGEGVLVCHWFPNDVEVNNSKDIIDGIERDLTQAFISYLEANYEVDIELEWIQAESFSAVLHKVKSATGGTFGASSISITDERRKEFNFTEPYMADVAVLMSNNKMPIALTEEELHDILSAGNGVSISNTTLLSSLEKLRDTTKTSFEIELVGSSGSVIKEIAGRENTFGYVDIVNFLLALENGEDVRRQFFFPVKLEGLAFIYSKKSDWNVPVSAYFSSQQFQSDRHEIVTRYLGADASEIIEQISKSAEMGPFEEIVLSHRERQAQEIKLQEAAARDRAMSKVNSILFVLIVAAVVILGLVFYLYYLKSKNNRQLIEQQDIIEQKNQQLKVINEEKNNLIQVLAHDLRSPLSNILNAAEILQADSEATPKQNQLLGFVVQSSQKMNGLIDKIMDVDAIETGKHNLRIESIDAGSLVDQVVVGQKARSDEKTIQVSVEVSEETKVSADKVYLSQILDNLLSNAIKYSEEGRKVGMSVKKNDKFIRFSVADQGPGLTEEDKSKIFMKYQRLSAKPTKGEVSVGLGLSIVKLFTERMNGKVSFETVYGEGTTFHVDLPKATQ